MAAAKCLTSLKLCRVRVTLLDEIGAPDSDYYVSDQTISLGFTPVISEGADNELRNGCGQVIASHKFPDVLKRFTFALTEGAVEPGLLAMLLGQSPILDPANADAVIGVDWNVPACGQEPVYVALEGWSSAEDCDHPDPDFPWWHFRWTSTTWQLGDNTLSADYLTPALTGFNRGNSEFGDPYSDLPYDGTLPITADFFSMWLQAEDPPTASCGVQQITP